MNKKDLGKVMILPWDNLFPLFETKIENMENGGYHIESNKCYILASAKNITTHQLILPTPKNNFDFQFIIDGELVEQKTLMEL